MKMADFLNTDSVSCAFTGRGVAVADGPVHQWTGQGLGEMSLVATGAGEMEVIQPESW